MKLRASWLSVCLAALAAFAPLRESLAAQKVDLEDYLGVVPMQGDSKTFIAESAEFTETAATVMPGARRSLIFLEQTEPDQPGSVLELQAVQHGKRLLRGTIVDDDGTDQLVFANSIPKKLVALKLKPNKLYKFKIGSRVFLNGVKLAKATNYGGFKFLGFEDIVTPLGEFPHCAHFAVTDNTRVKAHKSSFEVKNTIESWLAAGIGSVRFIQSQDVFDDGVLSEGDGMPPTEFLLDHGVLQGEPFGPPEPASAGASASSALGLELNISLPGPAGLTVGFVAARSPRRASTFSTPTRAWSPRSGSGSMPWRPARSSGPGPVLPTG